MTALLRVPTLRKLWTAHFTGAVGDRLGLLALLALTVQAAVIQHALGGGYRGVGLAVALVLGLRVLAAGLFGALLLGPLSALTSPQGLLDRRWTMIGSDAVRLALFVVAPLWIDWVPDIALAWLLVTVFVTGVAERLWNVAKDGAAPALLPARTGDGVRPGPDHLDALRRLDLRTGFVALPVAAAGLIAAALVNNLLGLYSVWFDLHHVALVSYVAAGLFAASIAVVYFLELPGVVTPRPRSPLEGLRRPKGPAGSERGRTGALPTLVLSCAAVAGAIAAAVSVAVLHAADLGGGPVGFGLLVLALTGGTVLGIRTAGRVLPALSRRRLMGLSIAIAGLALLLSGLVPDPTTVLLLSALAGYTAGVAANTGHVLIDQEAEEPRRPRTTAHLRAVARTAIGLAAIGAPVAAAAIGPHRVVDGSFTFDHGGAAFTLMLVGALLLPVAALVLGKLDDRDGVPLRRDLREAMRGGEPVTTTAANGFFIVVEGGDGAGKSTQVQALADWIRAKGHEVVVTREPGATALGKRLRSILLDVSSSGISHRAEALLYAADRAEHIDTVVAPALDRGAIVISDRYIDSSVAYQGAGRDLAPTEIARISRWATGGLVPHLTLLLDISPQTARERFTEAPDRLESEPTEFHDRVRRGFLTLAAADPARYLVIDAGQDQEAVTRLARHRLDQMLPLSGQEIEARAEAERKAAEEVRKRAEEEAAAKAEVERQERERQEQIARLRAEEDERKRLVEEERRREEAEREAEEARVRAEEQRRITDAERARREAEERAHAEEQDRLRRQKDEQDRLRAEAEARRLEKQRKAEESLLRAEQAREQARLAAESQSGSEPGADSGAGGSGAADSGATGSESGSGADSGPADGSGTTGSATGDDETRTIETPQPRPEPSDDRPDDATQTLRTPLPPTHDTRTMEVPRVPDAEETTVLPRFTEPESPERPEERTTVMPPVRDDDPRAQGDAPADRVPEWMFREGGDTAQTPAERTRELPGVDRSTPPAAPAPEQRRRPRPSWAEETPLDDLPSLADELLGPHDSYDSFGPRDSFGSGGSYGRGDTDPGQDGGGRR